MRQATVSKIARAPFPLRMPPELRLWLAHEAERNRRSQNAELIHRLEAMRQQELAKGAQA